MELEQKPGWQIISEVADTLKNPDVKAQTKAYAEEMRKKDEQTKKELVGRLYLSKILDIFSVILFIVVIGVVVVCFKKSLFEGFVSFIIGFWFLRFIFKKRNEDLFSKFQGWF